MFEFLSQIPKVLIGRLKSRRVLMGIFAFLFSLTYPVHAWLESDLTPYNLIAVIPMAALVYLVLLGAEKVIDRFSIERQSGQLSKKFWLVVAAVLFACWFISFLMNYPGCCSPDSGDSLRQLLGTVPFGNWTTLGYTLFVAPSFYLGNAIGGVETGVAFYSLFQMAYLSLVLAYSAAWLKAKGAPTWCLVLVVLFFALHPIIARYSITMWKDIPFSACILLLVLFLYDVLKSKGAILKERKWFLYLLALIVLMVFLRKNGLIIVVPSLIILCVLLKNVRRKLIIGGSGVLIACLFIQGPIYTALGVEPSPFAETVGIPLQQVTAVEYYDEPLDQADAEFIANIIPLDVLDENYSRRSIDGLKFAEGFNGEYLDAHKGEFLSLWSRLFLQHKTTYIRAWADSVQGYYSTEVDNWIVYQNGYFGDPGRNLIYEVTGVEAIDIDSKYQYDSIRALPLFFFVFNIAALVWISFGSMVLMFVRKMNLSVLALSPLVFLWLSMLLSAPTFCEFRYMFAFLLCLPLALVLPFLKTTEVEDRSEQQ